MDGVLLIWGIAAMAGACGSDTTHLDQVAPLGVGTLSVPLDTVGSSGALYRLSASLELRGPELKEILLSGPIPVVETQLLEGSYAATLLDPWRLSRVTDRPRAVDATLISPNPSFVQIEAGQRSRLVLQFRVGGEVVPPSEGTLEVVVEVDDGPAGEESCSAGGSRCIDELLERHVETLAGAFGCLSGQRFATEFGSVDVCMEAACVDGTPGCSLDGLEFEVASEVIPNGAVEVAASASFVRPIVVPIRLPSSFGGGTCTLGVAADFPAVVARLDTVSAGAGQVSPVLTSVSVGLPSVDVSLISGGVVCASVLSLAEEQLPAELQRLAEQRLRAELSLGVQPLVCTQCTTGCPLRCGAAE